MNTRIQKMLASYGRSVLGAAAAMYVAGITDIETLAYALVGAIIPVALRALNPNDPAFGRMPSESDVDTALKNAKVIKKKSVAKKAVKKK